MSELVGLAIEDRDGVVVAQVSGELDVAGASRTGDAIADAVPTTARGLVIDFSALDFIDSSGIAMLFGIARRLSSRRQELRVVAPEGGPVTRVLDIVEFQRAAPVVGDLEKALAELS
jgi:anti-anti-sigma factor